MLLNSITPYSYLQKKKKKKNAVGLVLVVFFCSFLCKDR